MKSLDSEVILGYTWVHYWLFPVFIYTRTAYDFIERCSGDSGGIVPVFTANSVYALPCACAARMEKETSKALKHWDDSLQLQNNHFTSRTPLDPIDYVQQTLVPRLECVSFVLLGGYQPFLGVVPFFFQLRKEQKTKISTRHHKHNKSRDASKKIKSFTQIKVLFTNYRDLLTFKMQIDKLDFNLLKRELC